MIWYKLLDWFFMVLHPAAIFFNLFGWIPVKTRKANLILLLLTGCSWLLLGIWYGLGYCPLTDWHFTVLEKLGEKDLPHSYIKYLLERIFSWSPSDSWTDTLTASFFGAALLCSLAVNIRACRKRRSMSKN
jgi:hypothetical protein